VSFAVRARRDQILQNCSYDPETVNIKLTIVVRYSGEAKVQPGHGTTTNIQSAPSGKRNMDKQIEGTTLLAHIRAVASVFPTTADAICHAIARTQY